PWRLRWRCSGRKPIWIDDYGLNRKTLLAGSVSLIGFGLDSFIEVASGGALVWRLHHQLYHFRREQVERTTLRIVGACFIALAVYILYESGSALIRHEAPERSIPGINDRRRRCGRHAGVGESEAPSRCLDWKRCDVIAG